MNELQLGARDWAVSSRCDRLSRPSKDPCFRNRLSVDDKLSAQIGGITTRRRIFESEPLGRCAWPGGQPGIAHLTGRSCHIRLDGLGVASLAKVRIRKINHESDLPGPRFADARLLHGRLLALDGRGPAPVHTIAITVADAGAEAILGTPEADNVLVDFFGSRQLDQVD